MSQAARRTLNYTPYGIGAALLLFLTLPMALSSHLRAGVSTLATVIWALIFAPDPSELARLENRVMELEAELALALPALQAPSSKPGVITARVIFRSHAAWQSYLWIDKGDLDVPFQLMDAPVLKGNILVGVVDEVKPHAAKVRLLTDPTLVPSVRVKRGSRLLAKGELNGASKPALRQSGSYLKGTGFNYDFPDEEGGPIDLREEIVKLGDLLITTGFDGLFPKGLYVAEVTKVQPLKEGDIYYNLEAKTLLGSFNSLEYLQLIPPLPSIQ
jgi:cell shape-determining protein MreC